MPLSRADLAQITAALNTLSAHARGELTAALSRLDLSDLPVARAAVEQYFPALVGQYGAMAAVLGGDVASAQIADLGVRPVVQAVPGVDVGRAAARANWAMGTPNPTGNLAVLLDELVKQPYRATVAKSSQASGVRYARVPQGATCEWCLVLAGRGAVYHSAGSAGASRKYHGECDCVPVPMRTENDYPEGYNPDALMQRYLTARDHADSGNLAKIAAAARFTFHTSH